MKPTIEYNGQIYEFEATFDMEKRYFKELKKKATSLKNLPEQSLSQEDFETLQELSVSGEKNIDRYFEEHPEFRKRINAFLEVANNLEIEDLQEKYCFEMLNKKYGISKEEWSKMQKQFADDYGFENLEVLFAKVIEKVFTHAVEKTEKKPLPEWMN